MPVVNGKKEILETLQPYEYQPEPSFSEVFGASVGFVIDEELSISSALNREGWADRREHVNALVSSGQIQDVKRYQTKGGRNRQIDYDKLAKDYPDAGIKSDAQLNQERNELLTKRRQYSDDVKQRGSGFTQFLGSMNAYMLDPINVLTVGIAAPVTTARAISSLGRAAMTARNAALIEGAAELGIQTLVYRHKADIGSDYTAADALANIGMAATGAAILGGTAAGLSAWLDKTTRFADDLPETAEVVAAKEYVVRLKNTVDHAPKGDDQLQADIDFLKQLDQESVKSQAPSKTAAIYEKIGAIDDTKSKAPPSTASQREREILTRQGIADEFDNDIAEFNQLENPLIQVDNEYIDAKAVVEQYNKEIKGLDDVLRCVYG